MRSVAASLVFSFFRRSGCPGMKRRLPVSLASLLIWLGPASGTALAAESDLGAPLAGSLLGALVFGYPFESVGTPDILLLLIIGLVLMRIASGKGRNNTRPGAGQNEQTDRESFRDQFMKASRDEDKRGRERRDDASQTDMQRRARATWDALRSRQSEEAPEQKAQGPATVSGLAGNGRVAPGVSVPRGFDVEDFLGGARALYARLQHSWAARDVDDLEPFVTASMLGILREQAALDPQPGDVQILLVTALLAGFSNEGGDERVSVTFDAVIHDGPESDKTEPVNVRELWHFVRGSGTGGGWRLDGIEQV